MARRPGFAHGTWVAVQFGIGGISTAINLDNRFNVGSHDSADLILRFCVKYAGQDHRIRKKLRIERVGAGSDIRPLLRPSDDFRMIAGRHSRMFRRRDGGVESFRAVTFRPVGAPHRHLAP